MAERPFIKDEDGKYVAVRPVDGGEITKFAQYLTSRSLQRGSDVLSSPAKVREYLLLHLSPECSEKFWCLFLDNRHRVIAHEMLFHGTIDGAAVYPRTVVMRVIAHNAAACIFAHNHPSGVAEPSDADTSITRKLTEALALIDVRVLDHLIVGNGTTTSMAERGLL